MHYNAIMQVSIWSSPLVHNILDCTHEANKSFTTTSMRVPNQGAERYSDNSLTKHSRRLPNGFLSPNDKKIHVWRVNLTVVNSLTKLVDN